MRNRWQMRQGPRRCPSLNVATGGLGSLRGAARSAAATLPRRYVGDIVESRLTSDLFSGALVDEISQINVKCAEVRAGIHR